MNPDRHSELTRQELYEKVWSAPTIQIAAELGISDVALAKRCKKLNVPKPSPGYWAKIAAGQTPAKTSLPAEPEPVKYEPLDGPIPDTLSLPDDKQDWHLVVVDARVALRDATPDTTNQCVKLEDRTVPRITISKALIDRATKALHVILTLVEARGIPFRNSRSKYESARFERSGGLLNLTIEEVVTPREPTVQEKRRHDWSWKRFVEPSGKLTFTINPERYAAPQSEKKWVESEKLPLEKILSQIVRAICKHYADLEKERAEAAERNRKAHEAWLVQRDAEQKLQHEASLEAAAHGRAEDLLKAAEWFRLYQTATEFIKECEQRWRSQQAGELTREQEIWLLWARDTAQALSPFESGYPNVVSDGVFDKAAVPFGGPYPARRDFPRPPTMPKIPPPVQQSGYSYGYTPEPKQQYPFWLKSKQR